MNREELEKMFDDNFYYDFNNGDIRIDLKKYIFDTIIVEILKSIIEDEYGGYLAPYDIGYNTCLTDIKQKVKELYNINL